MSTPVEEKRKPRLVIGVVAGTIVLIGLAVFATKVYLGQKPSRFLTEGFDFSLLRLGEIEWRGPEIGEKINLTLLESRDGKTLASIIDKRPIMLVALNPECAMCGMALDELVRLRNELANKNVNYYISFFNSQNSDADTFKYADGLNLGVPSFVWNKKSGLPPEAIFKMTTPSHMLIKSDGTVIRVWPGSYADKSVRDRMAHQILSETAVAIDTLNAVSRE